MGVTGQECKGLVKSVCRNRKDWIDYVCGSEWVWLRMSGVVGGRSRVSIEAGDIGQEFLQEWVSEVKSACRSRWDWSRVSMEVEGIGQMCLQE